MTTKTKLKFFIVTIKELLYENPGVGGKSIDEINRITIDKTTKEESAKYEIEY